MRYNPGDIIRFTYRHQSVDDQTGPPEKEVLVLHPNWRNKIHGIDLKRLNPAERRVLEMLLDPEMRDKPSRIPLINRIRQTMDPIEEIQNPVTFYAKFVKPFLRRTGADAYRQYIPKLMSGVTRIRKASIVTGKPKVEKPLFGQVPNPLAKKEPTEPEKPLTPADVMKQAQAQHQGRTDRAKQAQAVKTAKGLSPTAASGILKKFGLS